MNEQILFQIIDTYQPKPNIRTKLFEHLKDIVYDPTYISQFTGKPIDNVRIVKNIFGDIKNSEIKQFLIHPQVILEAHIRQLDDYLASLYKLGDPITKGKEWKPCKYCHTLFASREYLDYHIKSCSNK